MRAYCGSRFPQYLLPVGPGMTDKSVTALCYLHRITNRPDVWPREFHNWADAWPQWQTATVMLGLEGHDIRDNLTGIRFGDNPGWIIQHNTDLILCSEKIPKSAEELEQLLLAVVKAVKGKSADPEQTSVCDGPCTVPAPAAWCHACEPEKPRHNTSRGPNLLNLVERCGLCSKLNVEIQP